MAKKRDKILRDAEKLVQKGKIEAAIREYEKLLKETPNDANTINRIGDLYGRIGQVDKAVELYERIADHFTKDGFTTKAIAILKKINRLAPQRLDIFESLAELYIQQGLVVEAKNQYSLLADWYTRNEDTENAISAHRKLVELDPNNHIAHLKLADLLIQGGKAEEAIEVYDRLGKMLLEREKLDEAVQLYQHAVEQNPPSGDFLAPICNALTAAGRTEEAGQFLKAALQRSPDNSELQALHVRTLINMRQGAKALQVAEKILAVDPNNEEVRHLLGRALLSSGDVERARDMLLPAAEQYLGRSAFAEAQDLLKDLLKALPRDPSVLKAGLRAYAPSGNQEMLFTIKAALAETYFQGHRTDEARRLYVELLKVDPNNDMFRQRMAQLDGAAAPAAEPEIEEVPLDEVTGFEPAPVAEPTPAPAPAAAAPAAEVAAPPGEFDPQERLAEAAVFAKYGLIEKAANYLESIVVSYPDAIEARQMLVNLYIESGQPEHASDIAAPLVDHYRQAGDTEALENLLNSVPGLVEEVPAAPVAEPQAEAIPMPASAEELVPAPLAEEPEPEPAAAEDELIIVDIDEGLEEVEEPMVAEAPAPEPVVRTPAPEPTPAPVAEVPVIEPEPVIEEPVEELELIEAPVELVADEPTVAAPAEDLIEEPVEEIVLIDEPPTGEMTEIQAVKPAAAPIEEIELIDEPTTITQSQEIELVDEPAPIELVDEPAPPAASIEEIDEIELVDEPTTIGQQPEEIVLIDEPPAPAQLSATDSAVMQLTRLEQATLRDAAATAGPAQPADELVELSATFAGPSFSDLEKLDFFIDQELFEDSVKLLEKLQTEFPDDPDLAERRLVLKAKGVLLDEVQLAQGVSPEELFADEDDYIDIAQELKDELAGDDEAVVEEAEGAEGGGEAELEAVFREFQKGVAEQLSEEDSDTHFNLGIAYREMGLLPEAIREFQISSRDPSYFVECCSMIGVCYLEQGMSAQATDWYRKAMTAPELTTDAMNALRYDLAAALEAAGDVVEAENIFSEIAASDADFRDVADRLIALSAQRQAN
jgi:tetratricopeptide (TPR) repeat protein